MIAAGFFAISAGLAAESPKSVAASPERDAIIARLKQNGVKVQGLSAEAKDGGAVVDLGTGSNGGEADNANDENLALVALRCSRRQVFDPTG